MSRNRRNQVASIRLAPAMNAILLCLLIGGSGVGYVWQKKKISELGRQISEREKLLSSLRDQNEKLRKQLAMLRSPAHLEARVREWNLGLVPPQQDQIWRLVEPQPDPLLCKQERQYAVQQVNTTLMR